MIRAVPSIKKINNKSLTIQKNNNNKSQSLSENIISYFYKYIKIQY